MVHNQSRSMSGSPMIMALPSSPWQPKVPCNHVPMYAAFFALFFNVSPVSGEKAAIQSSRRKDMHRSYCSTRTYRPFTQAIASSMTPFIEKMSDFEERMLIKKRMSHRPLWMDHLNYYDSFLCCVFKLQTFYLIQLYYICCIISQKRQILLKTFVFIED